MTLPNSDDFDSLGGEIQDYAPVEDPTTDLPAEASNSLRASAAAMSNTCFRVSMSIYMDTAGDMSLYSIDAVWDTDATPDPVITAPVTGIWQIDFTTPVTDLRGNLQDLVLLGGIANPDIANIAGYFITLKKLSSTSFRLYIYRTSTDTLVNLKNKNINVMLR
jgi:hypothetical protein